MWMIFLATHLEFNRLLPLDFGDLLDVGWLSKHSNTCAASISSALLNRTRVSSARPKTAQHRPQSWAKGQAPLSSQGIFETL
jgi:hypothetical protein